MTAVAPAELPTVYIVRTFEELAARPLYEIHVPPEALAAAHLVVGAEVARLENMGRRERRQDKEYAYKLPLLRDVASAMEAGVVLNERKAEREEAVAMGLFEGVRDEDGAYHAGDIGFVLRHPGSRPSDDFEDMLYVWDVLAPKASPHQKFGLQAIILPRGRILDEYETQVSAGTGRWAFARDAQGSSFGRPYPFEAVLRPDSPAQTRQQRAVHEAVAAIRAAHAAPTTR